MKKKELFSHDDLEQIAAHGLTADAVEQQIENFRKGFPKMTLIDAATIANGGIRSLDDAAVSQALEHYATLAKDKRLLKFVPASGAASRMFKELFAFSATYYGVAGNFAKEYPEVQTFLENLRSFAFYNDLRTEMARASLDIDEYMQRGDYSTVINFLLKEQYLGYGSKPKALLKFHRYGSLQRTPLEEHIVEGASYALSNDGKVRLHFTVSPEHRTLFKKKISEIKRYYEDALGVKIEITLSEQKHYTDTIAVDEYNEPLRDDEGHLVFRPGGHGALLENLNECNADVIFMKNIDNVVPDWDKHSTIVYKKVLAGLLLDLQRHTFDYIRRIKQSPTDVHLLAEAEQFASQQLGIHIEPTSSTKQRREQLLKKLNRPIRVCGKANPVAAHSSSKRATARASRLSSRHR